MSFFFDVWTTQGFVLASDVWHTEAAREAYAHKIMPAPTNCAVPCAIVTCGDYFGASLCFFAQAVARRDRLRDIAEDFAKEWTERFAGTRDYSAVHIVGYDRLGNPLEALPQMWYWSNWKVDPEGFHERHTLENQLNTFCEAVPFNNHIPQLVKRDTGASLPKCLADERTLVLSYLADHQPVFTWNGDSDFWRSAAQVVKSVLDLLRPQASRWDLKTTAELARLSLEFLAHVGAFRSSSTVALSPEDQCDVLVVSPRGVDWKLKSGLPSPE